MQSTPWNPLRLKIACDIFDIVGEQVPQNQQNIYQSELSTELESLLKSSEERDFSSIDPQLLKKLVEYLVNVVGRLPAYCFPMVAAICVTYYHIGEIIDAASFLRQYELYSVSENPTGLNDLLNYVNPEIGVLIKAKLDADQNISSPDTLRGLFTVSASKYSCGVIGKIKLEDVSLSKRLVTDQVRIASHLVDESDVIADQTHAVCSLLNKNYSILKDKYLKIEYSIDQPSSILIGNSLGLGLAILGYIGLHMYRHNRAMEYRVYRDVGFTGGIDAHGQVQLVDEGTLDYKVKAVFFSSMKSLVLPAGQIKIAERSLKELNDKFPNKQLQLIPADSLSGIIDRRDVIYLQRRRILRRLNQFVHYYANSVTLTVLGFLALAALGFWFGIVKNPVPTDTLKDKNGLWIINKNGYKIGRFSNDSNCIIKDINNDGSNEIIVGYTYNADSNLRSKVFCYSQKFNLLWSKDLTKQITFADSSTDNFFSTHIIFIDDCNSDGMMEIFVKRQSIYFPTNILILSCKGAILSDYWHAGHINSYILEEIIPNNNTKELILCGENNEDKCGILAAINPLKTIGASNQNSISYQYNNYENKVEEIYIRFPHTHFASEYFRDCARIIGLGEDNTIKVAIFNNGVFSPDNKNTNLVYYNISPSGLINSIGISDYYYSEYNKRYPKKVLSYGDNDLMEYFSLLHYWQKQ